MSKFHEFVGQQTEEVLQLRDYFSVTQRLLADLIDGTKQLSDVVIVPEGWTFQKKDAE